MNVAMIIENCLDLNHFVTRPPIQVRRGHNSRETTYWELFHGRALDATMTRQQTTFESWNIEIDPAANEPLISVKWDHVNRRLYVTRAVLCHAHEVVPNNSNVIETRETTRWVREFVGQVNVAELPIGELETELQATIGQAVYGTGRLPLTSLETPLPQFLLGQLGYFPPGHSWRYRELELALRAPNALNDSNVAACTHHFSLADLRQLILNVSLSPYACLVSNMLSWLQAQQQSGKVTSHHRAEFLAWLLQLQWRHLNAYDLRKFHHRGANYPDALLIDEVLRELLAIIETEDIDWAADNAGGLRRGLRLGWFLHTMYAGQPVPERPTSPGENLRVMPFARVPEEQILQTDQRPRQLFDRQLPWSDRAEAVLELTLGETHHSREVAELGTALILDRPLGIFKAPGEPDATPLLAHVVYSKQLGLRNWEWIEERLDNRWRNRIDSSLNEKIAAYRPSGPCIGRLHRTPRPGVVSMEDLFQTADDFQILRTTRQTVQQLLEIVDLPSDLTSNLHRWHTILPSSTPAGEVLQVIDGTGKSWLTLRVDSTGGFTTRRGIERTKLKVV